MIGIVLKIIATRKTVNIQILSIGSFLTNSWTKGCWQISSFCIYRWETEINKYVWNVGTGVGSGDTTSSSQSFEHFFSDLAHEIFHNRYDFCKEKQFITDISFK